MTIAQVNSTALEQAQALQLPSREAMLKRSPSVQRFWQQHASLLEDAWIQWESLQGAANDLSLADLLDENLRTAVEGAWQDPTTEAGVKALWQEVSDGVYKAQFFNPERLQQLRDYLDQAADTKIPVRPPYGIELNRFGMMLDQRSEGYIAAPSFQQLYQMIMAQYMRPIARLLFPEVTGFDSQTFGFSIQYQPGMDTALQPHTDASSATMNINMNLPGETFTGSEVDFFDRANSKVKRLSFEPGMALIHRGSIPHAAQPILSGSRTNMVVWLYGERMQTPLGVPSKETLTAEQRWSASTVKLDRFAPF